MYTRKRVPKNFGNMAEKAQKAAANESRNCFKVLPYKRDVYIRMFYSALTASVFDCLNDETNGSNFANDLAKEIISVSEGLINDNQGFFNAVNNGNKTNVGSSFSLRTMDAKIKNGRAISLKLSGFKTNLNNIRKVFTQQDGINFVEAIKKHLTTVIETFNAKCDRVDLTFQVLLDSLTNVKLATMLAPKTQEKLNGIFGDGLYSGNWSVCVGVAFNNGITDVKKTWFGEENTEEEEDKRLDFNDKVVEALKNPEVNAKVYQMFNIKVEYKTHYLNNLNDEVVKSVLGICGIEEKDKPENLSCGTVRFTLSQKYPNPLSNFCRSKGDNNVVSSYPVDSICSCPTTFKKLVWRETYVNKAKIGVYPSSILSLIRRIGEDLKKELPDIINKIFDFFETKSDVPRIQRCIDMARLLRYFLKGKIHAESAGLLCDVLETLETSQINYTADIVTIKAGTNNEAIENAAYNLWINKFSIEDKEKMNKKKGIKNEYRKANWLKENHLKALQKIHCVPESICSDLMCPFFSLPFTECASTTELEIGSDIVYYAKACNMNLKDKNTSKDVMQTIQDANSEIQADGMKLEEVKKDTNASIKVNGNYTILNEHLKTLILDKKSFNPSSLLDALHNAYPSKTNEVNNAMSNFNGKGNYQIHADSLVSFLTLLYEEDENPFKTNENLRNILKLNTVRL